MMQPLRLGVIGCGIAARELHWPALRRLRDLIRVTAVCNRSEPKARSFARLVGGVPYVLDYRDLLARNDVDAVDVALPIDLNYAVGRAALVAGKHLFLEKPAAGTMREARRMLLWDRQYPRLVKMVAENFRYQCIFRRAAVLLKEGAIGTPYAAVWDVYHRIVQQGNPYARTAWRLHHRYPGGFITDAGVHNVAALRMLFGDLKVLDAATAAINRRIGKVDSMTMLFTAHGGLHGTLRLFFSAAGVAENRLLVFGSKGTMSIEGELLRVAVPRKKELRTRFTDQGGYLEEFTDFARAIWVGGRVVSTIEEGVRDVAVIFEALMKAS